MASGGAAGATSLAFVYSLDYARTRLANDSKSAKKGGERQFNGLVDVYRKTLATDGIAGLYRGFVISCVGIVVYRGLYFGLYDSIKPVVLTGDLAVSRCCCAEAGGSCVSTLEQYREQKYKGASSSSVGSSGTRVFAAATFVSSSGSKGLAAC